MSDIFEIISQKFKLYYTKGASDTEIEKAEQKLGRKFSNEYKNYLKKYGAVSFGSTELTGLNIAKYANVVDVTLIEIERYKDFPKDFIVLENLGVEGILALTNSHGEVIIWRGGKILNKYKSIKNYLEEKLKQEL
jgi:hypothetical protein